MSFLLTGVYKNVFMPKNVAPTETAILIIIVIITIITEKGQVGKVPDICGTRYLGLHVRRLFFSVFHRTCFCVSEKKKKQFAINFL